MNWKGSWKRSSRVALIGAYIGVLGIVGAQREQVWANDLSFRETLYNTDFVSAGVGSLRDADYATIGISGIKGTVTRAYLYWHGPMNTDFPLANATIAMDGRTVTGVHIGTSDDNCWGFDNSQAYRADVTAQVTAKRNGSYLLSQFVKQGTNINANGASMLVFFDDGNAANNRDVVLFEGNDSNAPNIYDALGWNALLPGVTYASGTAFLQMHVSDGQIYPDDSVILNGAVLRGRGSIFQGISVPSADKGPNGFGNLWDIKTWDITTHLVPGNNDFLLTHGYIQHDCISLIIAIFDLPATSAPPPPPGGTNNPPTVAGQPEIIVHSPHPIVVDAEARDNDGDALDYTIAIGNEIVSVGEVPAGVPQTVGRLSLTNAFPLGDHQVVFTVSDGRTNASFTTIVRVVDNTPPVIQATNIVVPTDPGLPTATVNYTVTATDDFPGDVAVVSLPPPGTFPIGVTTVTVTAVDASGNSSQKTFTITVTDALPPNIVCPPDIVRFTDPGANTAIVNYTVNATDNLPGLTVACTPPSGSAFPVGMSTVTCTAADAAGNTASCAFKVTVNVAPPVNHPPTLTGVTNLVIHSNTPIVITAVATDIDGNALSYTIRIDDQVVQTGTIPGGTPITTGQLSVTNGFSLGVHTVVFEVNDGQAGASFTTTVTVVGNIPPTLTGQAELISNSNAPVVISALATDLDGDALTYTIRVDGVVVQNGVVPAGTPVTTGTLAVTNTFSPGTHTVVFEVNDGQAGASFTTTVRIVDNTAPIIHVPDNIVVPVDPGMTNAVVIYTVTATDDFPGPIQIVVQPESGGTFPVGTTTVVATATDSSGNSSTATFTVTVVDNVPPTILCPPNIVRFAERGTNVAVVNYVVNASDNLPGAIVTCVPPSGSTFPLGDTTVDCTVRDAAGLTASCSFNINVSPQPVTPTNLPPAVVGQPEITVNHPNPIRVEALATDDDGNPLTYTIRIDGVEVQAGTLPAGMPQTIGTIGITNAFTLGNHSVLFSVSDGQTNASFTTVVHVIDITPPVIHVPDNIVVPVDPGMTTAVVTYTVTATDNFPGQINILSLPPSGTAFPIGTTTVTVTATDASGNQATATFTITVVDNVPPQIHCPADIVRFNDPGTNVAMVYYTVNATDNLPGVTLTCTPASGSVFPVGTTQVTCVARDAAGNRATCVFNVTIQDQPPVVNVPTNIIVAADLGQCSGLVNYTVTVQDNSPGWTLVCVPPSGSVFPAGTTTVICTATDAAGNQASNSFTVTVVDREKPTLHLPANITVTAPTNELSAIVNYVVTATDNCSGVTLVTVPPSGSAFPVGTTIVQCTATDAAGNVATGTFTITVLPNNGGGDTEPPVIVDIIPGRKCLWPPNHKMVNVTFRVKATDNSGLPVTAEIISITSNEPENELGDGNTEHDWSIVGPLKAQLRAERSGLGSGRVYTIVIAVRDAAGNVATGITTVCVPHDQGQKNQILAASARSPKVIAPARLVRVTPAKKK